MLTRDDQAAIVVVIEVGEELRLKPDASLTVNLLVQCSGETEDGNIVDQRSIGHGMGNVFHACSHAVKRAMRLEMRQLHASLIQKPLQGTDLVNDDVRHLTAVNLHFAAAETGQIRQGEMRPGFDTIFFCKLDCAPHVIGIGTVKPAGDVGLGNVRHQLLVIAKFVEAEALSHVAVDIDDHSKKLLNL